MRIIKQIVSILIFFWICFYQCQATVFRGVLLQNDPKGPAVSNVVVLAKGAQSVVSRTDGTFDLDLPSNSPGTQIKLTLAKKGLVAIHSIMLYPILSADTNASRTIILVSRPDSREEMAERYFRFKGEKAADNHYEEKVKQLDVAHPLNVAVAYERLGEQLVQAKAIATGAAVDLAKDIPENNSSMYRLALRLFLDEKLDKTLEILNNTNFQTGTPSRETGNQSLEHGFKLKGELLALNSQFADAAKAYASAVELVPDDVDANFELGLLYQNSDRLKQAEESFNQCLALARKTNDRRTLAMTLIKLGELHIQPIRMDEAQKQYEEALAIGRQSATNNPQTFLPIAAYALDNLGKLYLCVDARHKYRPEEAFKAFSEALDIYRQLTATDSERYLPDVAGELNVLGVLYSDVNRWPEAGKMLEQALACRRQLATNAPSAYLPDVAMTLKNLGYLYQLQDRPEDSHKAYVESLDIYKRLTKSHPGLYEPNMTSLQDILTNSVTSH